MGFFSCQPRCYPSTNIHQLYQDLFITDMKDEIAFASNEVVHLREQLLEKEKQNTVLKK